MPLPKLRGDPSQAEGRTFRKEEGGADIYVPEGRIVGVPNPKTGSELEPPPDIRGHLREHFNPDREPQYRITPHARDPQHDKFNPGTPPPAYQYDEKGSFLPGGGRSHGAMEQHKVEPIEMTQIGVWTSWLSHGLFGGSADDSSAAGGNAPGASGGAPGGIGGGADSSHATMGGFLDRRMADAALGPPGGAPEPSLARARTPYHSTSQGWARHRFPQAPGRARTPWHDTHPGISAGGTGEHAAGGGTIGTWGSLKSQRERFRKELEEKPGLREKILGISVGENLHPSANLSVMETMMNRAAMRGKSLESESLLHRTAPGFRTAPYQHGGNVAGYYAGYAPQNLRNPKYRAMAEANLAKALGGSNVSNFATGNASGTFATSRIAKGVYPGGLRSKYGYGKAIEYFVGEGTAPGYSKWLQASKAGGQTGTTSAPTGGAGGGFGAGAGAGAAGGAAAGGASVGGRRQRMPGASLAHVDPRLQEIMEAAATHMPPGYHVRATSGYRPHQTYGFHPKGMAADYQIIGPRGAIPNRGGDPTGMYTRLARAAKGEQQSRYPELTGRFAWGGAFGTVPGGTTSDLMHFDIGGERGHIRNRMLRNMTALPGERYGRRGE